MRAFQPIMNKKFLKLTSCSTSMNNMCIYETFYYLYVKPSLILKNQRMINEDFQKESPEI